MKRTQRTSYTNHEDNFNLDDEPEVMSLNFPPTEIDRLPTDTYVPVNKEALNKFAYPNDVERRNYQFEISELCCKQNTLVCLPTGSGKTLIAAVVIMNFYRWYPTGKIIFMAPYRTLVNQQIEACSSFTNIKDDDVTILISKNGTQNRKQIWDEKKVFFCTPQIVQNDIMKGKLDPTSICLVVLDEAHHARKNYAYVTVVRLIAARNSQFRVVALSATPGSDMKAIQAVIFNLMISKVVYKDDNDPDIAKYQHETNVEIIKVPLGIDENNLEDYLCQCISSIANILHEKGYIKNATPKWLTRGVVWKSMEMFKQVSHGVPDFFKIIDMFSILLSLATMQEKLTKYGASMFDDAIHDFVKKRKETENKKNLVKLPVFQTLLRNSEIAKNISHPKLAKLSEILGDFYAENRDSRVIIFTQFRAPAYAIVEYIKNLPQVKASIFIGKADTTRNQGLNESTQLEIVSLFRHGNINCIVATSVAEEGLDIGEVDLIVCYDTSSSPLKTVQRMGRTGRKRTGKVIFLMSEGYEERNLEKAQFSRSMIKNRLTSNIDQLVLYSPEKPNLPVPDDCRPFNIPCSRKSAFNILSSPDSSISSKQQKKSTFAATKETKSPFLQRNEMHTLEVCYSLEMKYHPLSSSQNVIDMGFFGISHSAESSILNMMKSGDDQLPAADRLKIEALMKKYEEKWSINGKNKNENIQQKENIIKRNCDPFSLDFSDDDADETCSEIHPMMTTVKSPEIMTPNSDLSQSQARVSFLSDFDLDMEEDYEVEATISSPNFRNNNKNDKNDITIFHNNFVNSNTLRNNLKENIIDNNISSNFTNKYFKSNNYLSQISSDAEIEKNKNKLVKKGEKKFKKEAPKLVKRTQPQKISGQNSKKLVQSKILNFVENKKPVTSFLDDDDDEDFIEDFEMSNMQSLESKNGSSDDVFESECPDMCVLKQDMRRPIVLKFLDSDYEDIDFDE